MITVNADCEKEIKTRITLPKTAFDKIKKMITNITLNIYLRVRILKSYVVQSTLMYDCKTWTVKKNMKKD